jgi:hypothetical protein
VKMAADLQAGLLAIRESMSVPAVVRRPIFWILEHFLQNIEEDIVPGVVDGNLIV